MAGFCLRFFKKSASWSFDGAVQNPGFGCMPEKRSTEEKNGNGGCPGKKATSVVNRQNRLPEQIPAGGVLKISVYRAEGATKDKSRWRLAAAFL